MKQRRLSGLVGLPETDHPEPSRRVVNVASVPQRSPFRYPGGKTWLVPTTRKWLASRPARPAELIEPFAGGASIALAAVFDNQVDRAHLVELDANVAAVWSVLFGENFAWLARRIRDFKLTGENVAEILDSKPKDEKAQAFQVILRNRVSHGGIMAPGSGLIKNGEAGKGISSRWYPETLEKRMLAIGNLRERFLLTEGDGIEVVKRHAGREDVVFFVDPPYTASAKRAGKRLYQHNELDHDRLFATLNDVAGDFLITYDDAPEVRDLAAEYGFDMELVAMKNTHHAMMTELLIGRNLDWIR